MNHSILACLQIVPQSDEKKAAEALSKAHAVIEQSGLHYQKENFGITIEGKFDQLVRIIEAIELSVFNSGVQDLLMNIQLRISNGKNLKLKK